MNQWTVWRLPSPSSNPMCPRTDTEKKFSRHATASKHSYLRVIEADSLLHTAFMPNVSLGVEHSDTVWASCHRSRVACISHLQSPSQPSHLDLFLTSRACKLPAAGLDGGRRSDGGRLDLRPLWGTVIRPSHGQVSESRPRRALSGFSDSHSRCLQGL